MKRLYILRHAKAVPAGGDDFARELSPRGHADAARMGIYLERQGYVPDLALCSAARRTVETWHDVSSRLAKPPPAEFLDTLYLAPAAAILSVLHRAPARAASLIVIGHNPGLENLARHLAGKPKGGKAKERLRAMTADFPTCALAVLAFDSDAWKDIAAASGALEDFAQARELGD